MGCTLWSGGLVDIGITIYICVDGDYQEDETSTKVDEVIQGISVTNNDLGESALQSQGSHACI